MLDTCTVKVVLVGVPCPYQGILLSSLKNELNDSNMINLNRKTLKGAYTVNNIYNL